MCGKWGKGDCPKSSKFQKFPKIKNYGTKYKHACVNRELIRSTRCIKSFNKIFLKKIYGILLSGFIYFFLIILTTKYFFTLTHHSTKSFPHAIFISPAPFLKIYTNSYYKQTNTHTHTHTTQHLFLPQLPVILYSLTLFYYSAHNQMFVPL